MLRLSMRNPSLFQMVSSKARDLCMDFVSISASHSTYFVLELLQHAAFHDTNSLSTKSSHFNPKRAARLVLFLQKFKYLSLPSVLQHHNKNSYPLASVYWEGFKSYPHPVLANASLLQNTVSSMYLTVLWRWSEHHACDIWHLVSIS